MLTYTDRDSFLQKIHPAAMLSILAVYIFAFIEVKNPIYNILILISLLLLSYVDGCIKELFKYARLILPFAILVIVLNPLIVQNGSTAIYKIKSSVPVIGGFRITLEAIVYGGVNALRMMGITMVFGFGNLVIHPDKSFGFFSKFLKQSSLLMSMIFRFFPDLVNKYVYISQVEKLRGNFLEGKNFREKIKQQGNIVKILFLSSLEDAGDIAESMYSRGYGIGKRSTYFKMDFHLVDKIFIILSIIIIILMIYLLKCGMNDFQFYPRTDNLIKDANLYMFIFAMLFYIPIIVYKGWKTWK